MDLFILKTDVEKFTSTYEKTLHMIFKVLVVIYEFSTCVVIIAWHIDNSKHQHGVLQLTAQ